MNHNLIVMSGKLCFPKNYKLYVLDKNTGCSIEVTTIPAIKNGDFCYGCFFEKVCHTYKGLSPFGKLCMTTIFIENKVRSLSK